MYLLPSLRLCLLFVTCLLCGTLQGQYYFEKLTEEDGLSDNRATCFLKDKTGFIWIGTRNGLNRYDGNSFRVFKPGNGNSISNEVINDIIEDSSGRIWVATMEGINIYDPLTNRWETMIPAQSNQDKNNDLPNFIIWDLYKDEQNQIWIVSDVWELSSYDPVKKKFTYYDWPAFARQKMFEGFANYRSIQKITPKSENEFWLASNIGLFSMDKRSGEFKFYGSGYNNTIRDLYYDAEYGNVYVISDNEEFFCYDEKRNLYQKIIPSQQALIPAHRSFKKEQASLLQLPYAKGMLEINRMTKEAMVIAHQPSLPASLLPGSINSIYTDNTNLTWIATNSGINKYNRNDLSVDFIPFMNTSDNKTEDGMSGVVYDATENNYYVCSANPASVFILNDKTGTITTIRTVDGKPLSACLNLYQDNEKNIWLLTETNVYRYNKQTKLFTLFATPNNNRPVIFRDILQDINGDYWLATWLDGLYLYKPGKKSFYRFTAKDSLYATSITALANDPVDHTIWIGTSGSGVYRYDLQSGRFSSYKETAANPEYLQLSVIEDIEADATGKIWITTYGGGVYVYHRGMPYEKSFVHYTMKQGLSSNDYFSISSGDASRLWLLSGKGLSVMDTAGRFLSDIRRHPAMSIANFAPERKYPKRIVFNSIKNEVLVAVNGGLLFYYPRKNSPARNFPVVFTDISVGGRSVMYDSFYRNKKNVEISYTSNSLSFQFASLTYTGSGNILYEYKLHEKDTEWKPVEASNTLNFPDLPNGHYTFIVRAKNVDGDLSSGTASFSFRIRPPFWKTWWFYLLASWLIAAIVYWIYRYQLNKKLEVERLRLRISRDLHDDIGSALTSINVLSKVALSKGNNDKEIAGYLSRIKDSTSITMESMSDIVWAINPKNDKLEALMSRMKEFAADICEAKNIDLDFTLPAELEKLSLNLAKRKNLFLVFKEAVNNAVKYSECTLLRVSFGKTGNKLQMIIEDNGKGFNKATVTGGNGLHNMKERAIECDGQLHVESGLEKGTRIVLEIPITRFGVSINR